MNAGLLRGELVRLAAPNPETDGALFSKWSQDSEYARMLDSDPASMWSAKKFQEWLEKDLEKKSLENTFFMIQSLDDGRTLGFVGLDGIRWNHGDAYAGIGLGDRQDWSKGYGTDAMHIILRYAFTELNLHRVSLNVFEYNTRGIRSYEKAGFVHEGRARQQLNREGRRWDLLFMGILREDWEKRTSGT